MITIKYDPNSKDLEAITCADGEIKTFADTIEIASKSDKNIEFTITNALLLDEVRARICEKKINFEKVELKFNDTITKIDENGRLFFPRGWPDYQLDCLMRIR